ncbi:hypothetical protein DY251_05290 [Mesorhizobium denitrificans]|uniref:Uncharacterized protein n=1 Tax=Mesorhizobium denitrificans TaxID=2294114 RepID=A0A371XGN8_9HYPH|nr:hypothetical protein DY251_05290 [Mesorhizobium denitrificans]
MASFAALALPFTCLPASSPRGKQGEESVGNVSQTQSAHKMQCDAEAPLPVYGERVRVRGKSAPD